MSTIYDECSKDELLQIAYEMQKDLNDSKKENKDLQFMLDAVKSDLVGATNDYKQASNEIALLNKQIDRQITDIESLTCIKEENENTIKHYIKENDKLKFRLKMLTKVCLNSIYGITVYIDTDSIKETENNDDNN